MVRELTRAHTNAFINTYNVWNRNSNWKTACKHKTSLKTLKSVVTKMSKPH